MAFRRWLLYTCSMLSVSNLFVDGVRSAVHDTAPGGPGEAVVFVHGNPGPMDDWEELIPAVSTFARVVAPDMPGYGRADHPKEFDFTVDGYARHLGGLLDQLGVKRAHLVLHDFGGAWGLRWAIDHPDAFASVTLINTGILRGYTWHKYAKIWQTPVLGELFQLTSSARLLHLAMNQDNPRPVPRSFIDRVMRYADWGHKTAVLKLYRASKDPEAAFGALADRASLLDRPACVIWGAGDKYLPVAYAGKQKEFFPQAEVHELPGLGHWPFMDDPAAVRGVLVPFLRRQVTGA